MKRYPKTTKVLAHALIGAAFMAAFLFPPETGTQLLLVFCAAALYAASMTRTLWVIRRYEVEGIGGFILSDLLYAFFPALVTGALFELVYSGIVPGPDYLSGIGTLILLGTTLFMTLLFWLLYLLTYLKYK